MLSRLAKTVAQGSVRASATRAAAASFSTKASFADVYDRVQAEQNAKFKSSGEFENLAKVFDALQGSGAVAEQLAAGNFNTAEVEGAPAELKPAIDAFRQAVTDKNAADARAFKDPVRVAVTGAAGQIGYSLLFRIASGEMLGRDQPVILHLLDIEQSMGALQGVIMELNDCAFPLLAGIETASDARKGFAGVDYALLVGAKPRSKGMERGDLLKGNAKIFQEQGQALSDAANPDVKVVVVGNPANTNALIAASNAANIPSTNFSAMTRLDHNRALAQIAAKAGCATTDITRFAIWGNHSPTMYPDLSHTLIKGKWAKDVLNDAKWVKDSFMPTVQQRGAEIIKARGASSAASAASSAIDHVHDWALGSNGWTSMAVLTDNTPNSYGVDEGLYFSFPVVCEFGGYTVVGNVPIDEFSAGYLEATRKELVSERDAVKSLIGPHL